MRKLVSLILLALVVGCAETDPYVRPVSEATGINSAEKFVSEYNSRWPNQFKSVQTVTIDFGLVSKVMIGYLVVQQPGRFRLNAMTEQGLTLFEIAHIDGQDQFRVNAGDFNEMMLASVSRDIQRLFLRRITIVDGQNPTEPMGYKIKFVSDKDGSGLGMQNERGVDYYKMVGRPAIAEREVHRRFLYGDDREEYRVDYYEYEARSFPKYIVLRERAIGADETPYKLTINVTKLKKRDKPWPARVFVIQDDAE